MFISIPSKDEKHPVRQPIWFPREVAEHARDIPAMRRIWGQPTFLDPDRPGMAYWVFDDYLSDIYSEEEV